MDNKNIIQLDSSAYELIKQDKANITLTIETTKPTKSEVQISLKEKAAQVFKMLKEYKTLESSSQGQSITDNYIQKNEEWVMDGFKGTFNIGLLANDFDILNQAIDEVQEIAQVSQINTSISTKTKNSLEEKLTQDAIKAFKARGEVIATAFGFQNFTLGQINVSRPQNEFAQRNVSMLGGAMASSMRESAPTTSLSAYIQPSTERITVNVSGTITLGSKGIVQ
jgi:predicted secreted protein